MDSLGLVETVMSLEELLDKEPGFAGYSIPESAEAAVNIGEFYEIICVHKGISPQFAAAA